MSLETLTAAVIEYGHDGLSTNELMKIIDAYVANEVIFAREYCAKVCEAEHAAVRDGWIGDNPLLHCAKRIRNLNLARKKLKGFFDPSSGEYHIQEIVRNNPV